MREIDSLDLLEDWLHIKDFPPAVFQNLNFIQYISQLREVPSYQGSLFLGCDLELDLSGYIVSKGGVVIPDSSDVEFEVHRSSLYQVEELFSGFDINDPNGFTKTKDYKIYSQYINQGKDRPESIQVSLYRRLHDHSITDALEEILQNKKIVAVMGGHGMERGEVFYTKVAKIARDLTKSGYLLVSGGGPGAMEATHLGAYFATRTEEDLLAAIEKLKIRPDGAEPGQEYNDPDWLHRAWKILSEYPLTDEEKNICMSIGIPTWLYGHEPSAPFATHIAKYFANSVREEGLLAIAKHGVIFAPGSAGTTQEIFQDACQNHYGSMGVISPMILFGVKRWTEERPVWDFLKKVSQNRMYGELLALTDNDDEVIRRIKSFQPDIYSVIK